MSDNRLNKSVVGLNKSNNRLNKPGDGLNKPGVELKKSGNGLEKPNNELNKSDDGLNKPDVEVKNLSDVVKSLEIGTETLKRRFIMNKPITRKQGVFNTPLLAAIFFIALAFTSAAFAQALTITTEILPDGKVGQYYLERLDATEPAEWSIASGSLPPGFETYNIRGYWVISGTPTALGTYTFTLKAENVSGSDTKEFTINIVVPPPPVITTTSLPDGKVGQYYNGNLQATEQSTWSIASGSLPPGFEIYSIYSGGQISGTPTTVGTYTFTLKAENVSGSDTKQFTIKIVMPEPPVITTTSLQDGKVGQYYGVTLQATDYAEWSIVSGSLPPGFELESSGYIRGEPTAAGTYTFTVKAENASGSDTKELTIKIVMQEPPVITTTSSGCLVGVYCYQNLQATEQATWSIASGSLPPSFQLSSYGEIYGTATEEMLGKTYTFTLKAENAGGSDTKELTIKIVSILITTEILPDGKVGQYYGVSLQATDGAQWNINAEWSIVSGSLPPGLQLYSSRYIEGIPTTVGTYTFTVKAENVAGSDTKQFTITIEPPPPPVITTTSLSDGEVGEYYSQRLQATEQSTWSIASGSLPPGFQLESSGYIYGEPPTEAMLGKTYTFTVKAENAGGSDTKEFTIKIEPPLPPKITTTSLPNGKVGQSYGDYFGGPNDSRLLATKSVTWSIASGSLPPGLEIREGYYWSYISGTPTEVGTYTFTVKAEGESGSDTKELSIKIVMPEPPVITTTSLQDGKVGQYYNGNLQATEQSTWSLISGSLPPGFEIYSGGQISGTPTTVGTYTFTLKAENASGSDTKELTIKIVMPEPPVITTTSLQDGKVGQYYWERLDATEYAEWSIASGSLPPEFEIYSGGQIYGTATSEMLGNTYTFTVKAENAAGSDTKQFSIRIRSVAEAACIAEGKVWEGGDCRAKTPAEACREAGNTWTNGECKTPAQLAAEKAQCEADGNTWINRECKTPEQLAAEKAQCETDGKVWENNTCTTPIRLPQIASSNIIAYAMGNNIVLQNLPANAKVEVFGLNGKLITTSHSPLATSHLGSDMSVSVHTKGVYIVKVTSKGVSNTPNVLRVAVR